MCIFSVAYRVLHDCPLLILTNREEQRTRPTLSPRIVDCPGGPAWLGGIDLRAGGTWLGINQFGLVAAITNRRKGDVTGKTRSRGLLCRELLRCRSVDAAVQQTLGQLQHYTFDGFNVLLFERRRAVVVESADDVQMVHLSAGIHTITNGTLNDRHDLRVCRVQEEVERLAATAGSLESRLAAAGRICGLSADGKMPGICLAGGDWGTVSSTLIALPRNLARVRYHYAPGPPTETLYHDYSPLARQLLVGFRNPAIDEL